MLNRPLRVFIAFALVLICIGVAVSSQQTGPSIDSTRRAVVAAEAFLATLTPPQRLKANLDLNEKTRTVWSNLPTGVAMQVGATVRNGLKLGDMTPPQEKAAWRAIFDYYVFGASERAGEHLPTHARGNLAPMDEIKARRLRAFLINRLNR